jgi:rRNA processing
VSRYCGPSCGFVTQIAVRWVGTVQESRRLAARKNKKRATIHILTKEFVRKDSVRGGSSALRCGFVGRLLRQEPTRRKKRPDVKVSGNYRSQDPSGSPPTRASSSLSASHNHIMGPSNDASAGGHRTTKRPPHKSHNKNNKHTTSETTRRRREEAKVVMSVEAFAHQKNKGAAKAIEGFKKRREAQRLGTAKELRSYQRLMKREGYVPGSGASRRRRDVQGEEEDDDDVDDDGIDVVEDQQAQRSVDSRGHKESGRRGDRDSSARASTTTERSAASKGDHDDFFQQVDAHGQTRLDHGDDGAAARKRPAQDDDVVAQGAARAAAASSSSSSSSHPTKDRLPHKASKHHSPHKSSLQRAADRRLEQIQQEQERRKQQEKIRAQKLRERKQRTKMLGERTKKGQPIMKNIVHDILRKLEREKEQEQQQQQQAKK